jgi:zinc protease
MRYSIILLSAALVTACATQSNKSDTTTSAQTRDSTAVSAPAHSKEQPLSSNVFELPYLQKELDNGLKVIVIKTPQKGMVSLQIPVQTGSRNEIEPGKSGFAHFFEHMMFRGTPKYPAETYGALIQATGADQNAFTDDDWTNYHTHFSVNDLEKVLELEADRFQNLAYTEEQFRTEAQAVKGEYLKNYSNPILKAIERLQDIAFEIHPYKHTTMGFFQDIENMPNQLEYAKLFFERWYKPEYTTVIVAGDVDLEPTIELVKKYWASWPKGDFQAQIPKEPLQTKAHYEHVTWQGPTLPWIVLGWKAPAFTAQSIDSAALTVLSEIYFGETSDVYQKLVVKEQLVDQLYVQPSRNVDTGLFLLALRLTDAKHTTTVIKAIEETLIKSRSHLIAEKSLADSKSFLRYSFANQLDSAAEIGATAASFVHYERDIGTLNRFYNKLAAVSNQDILNIANQVFTDNNRSMVTLSNTPTLAGADSFTSIDPLIPQTPISAITDELSKTQTDADAAQNLSQQQQIEINRHHEVMRSAKTHQIPNANSPLVDVSIYYNIGASTDPNGKKGITDLAATLIANGGTIHASYSDIQKRYYPLASGLNVQVDKEGVKFFATVHRDNLDAWWKIASDQIIRPKFSHEDFWRIKTQQLNAIRVSLRANNDEELAKELLYQQVYGANHPYGTLTAGKASDIEKITLAMVKDHWSKNFGRERIQVGIAGNYPESFVDRVLADLGQIRSAPNPHPSSRSIQAPTQRSALVIEKSTPSVAVSFGSPLLVKRGDPDWLALWLVRSWLGEHRSSSGQLYNRIRELRGMNYGNYAYIEYFPNGMYLMQPEPGYPRQNDLFQIWLRPLRNNNDAVFATRAALFELDRLLKNGLTAEQFEQTRNFLRKNVDSLTSTQSKQLGYLIDSAYYGIPSFNDYVKQGLDKLNVTQVNEALRKHVRLDNLSFVFVTADAKDLSNRLISANKSEIVYNTPKSADVLAEDKVISTYRLGLNKDQVKVVDGNTVFE